MSNGYSRETEFRQRIGIDSLPEPGGDVWGVVARWPDPGREAFLTSQGWRTTHESTWPQDDGAVREWTLARGEERLSVKLFVSSAGVDPARSFLLQIALSSALANPPFDPHISGEVLTLRFKIPPAAGTYRDDILIRVYRNIAYVVRTFQAAMDFHEVAEVADWLLQIAVSHKDLFSPGQRPPMPSQPDLPDADLVGREIHVDLPAAPDAMGDFRATNYQVQIEIGGGAIELIGFEGRKARFNLVQAGPGTIRIQAIDRHTLLSNKAEFTVEVQGSPPAESLG